MRVSFSFKKFWLGIVVSSISDALNAKDAQIRKIRDECQALMVELQMVSLILSSYFKNIAGYYFIASRHEADTRR